MELILTILLTIVLSSLLIFIVGIIWKILFGESNCISFIVGISLIFFSYDISSNITENIFNKRTSNENTAYETNLIPPKNILTPLETSIFIEILENNIAINTQLQNKNILQNKENAYKYFQEHTDEIRSIYLMSASLGDVNILPPQTTNDSLMNRFILENKEDVRKFLLDFGELAIESLEKKNEELKMSVGEKNDLDFHKKYEFFLETTEAKKILANDLSTQIIKHDEYSSSRCDIKGNISYTTGEKIYHLPGCEYYNSTILDTNYGEKLFCSEKEAKEAGWRKAYNCY